MRNSRHEKGTAHVMTLPGDEPEILGGATIQGECSGGAGSAHRWELAPSNAEKLRQILPLKP
jgi:hypothetical protein